MRARRRSCLRRAGGYARARSTATDSVNDGGKENSMGKLTSFTSLQVKRTVERRYVGLRVYGSLMASCKPGRAVARRSDA